MVDEKQVVEISEKRKASDILLGLEDKVSTLTKMMGVFDMNTKFLLDRINYVYLYIKQVQELDAQSQNQEEQHSFPDEQNVKLTQQPIQILSSNDGLIEETAPKGHRRISRSETYSNPISTQPIMMPTQTRAQQIQQLQTQPKQQVSNQSSDKKVPVIQRITDHTGKDIFMGAVSILNENKEEIYKTKTNAVGKWQAHLNPGKYIVNIVKTDTATKNKIEATQEINVSGNTGSVLTLPVMIIKR
jgi:hypothetical protein